MGNNQSKINGLDAGRLQLKKKDEERHARSSKRPLEPQEFSKLPDRFGSFRRSDPNFTIQIWSPDPNWYIPACSSDSNYTTPVWSPVSNFDIPTCSSDPNYTVPMWTLGPIFDIPFWFWGPIFDNAGILRSSDPKFTISGNLWSCDPNFAIPDNFWSSDDNVTIPEPFLSSDPNLTIPICSSDPDFTIPGTFLSSDPDITIPGTILRSDPDFAFRGTILRSDPDFTSPGTNLRSDSDFALRGTNLMSDPDFTFRGTILRSDPDFGIRGTSLRSDPDFAFRGTILRSDPDFTIPGTVLRSNPDFSISESIVGMTTPLQQDVATNKSTCQSDPPCCLEEELSIKHEFRHKPRALECKPHFWNLPSISPTIPDLEQPHPNSDWNIATPLQQDVAPSKNACQIDSPCSLERELSVENELAHNPSAIEYKPHYWNIPSCSPNLYYMNRDLEKPQSTSDLDITTPLQQDFASSQNTYRKDPPCSLERELSIKNDFTHNPSAIEYKPHYWNIPSCSPTLYYMNRDLEKPQSTSDLNITTKLQQDFTPSENTCQKDPPCSLERELSIKNEFTHTPRALECYRHLWNLSSNSPTIHEANRNLEQPHHTLDWEIIAPLQQDVAPNTNACQTDQSCSLEMELSLKYEFTRSLKAFECYRYLWNLPSNSPTIHDFNLDLEQPHPTSDWKIATPLQQDVAPSKNTCQTDPPCSLERERSIKNEPTAAECKPRPVECKPYLWNLPSLSPTIHDFNRDLDQPHPTSDWKIATPLQQDVVPSKNTCQTDPPCSLERELNIKNEFTHTPRALECYRHLWNLSSNSPTIHETNGNLEQQHHTSDWDIIAPLQQDVAPNINACQIDLPCSFEMELSLKDEFTHNLKAFECYRYLWNLPSNSPTIHDTNCDLEQPHPTSDWDITTPLQQDVAPSKHTGQTDPPCSLERELSIKNEPTAAECKPRPVECKPYLWNLPSLSPTIHDMNRDLEQPHPTSDWDISPRDPEQTETSNMKLNSATSMSADTSPQCTDERGSTNTEENTQVAFCRTPGCKCDACLQLRRPIVKTQLDIVKTQLDIGETQLDIGETQLDIGETQLDIGETQLDIGETQLDIGETQLDIGETQLDIGETQLDIGETQLDIGETQLDIGETQLDIGETHPEVPNEGMNENYDFLDSRYQQPDIWSMKYLDEQMDNDTSVTTENRPDVTDPTTTVDRTERTAAKWSTDVFSGSIEFERMKIRNQLYLIELLYGATRAEKAESRDTQMQMVGVMKQVTINRIELEMREADNQVRRLNNMPSTSTQSEVDSRYEALCSYMTECTKLKTEVEKYAQDLLEQVMDGLHVDWSSIDIPLPNFPVISSQMSSTNTL